MLPWILKFMKGEYHNLSVNLSFNPIIFVVAGIFSAITVWVSIKKPFKIAATISPIEATRYYEKDNYHSANKNRLSFKNRIIEMAWRNLRRKFKAYHIYRLIHDTLHYSPKQFNRNRK